MRRRAWFTLRSSLRIASVAVALFVVAIATVAWGAWWPRSTLFGEVVVEAPPRPRAPRIALTFDDGPDPIVTPRVLDALLAAKAHATFFVCGLRAQGHPEILRRIAAEGHSIGNHTLEHAALPFLAEAAMRRDVAATQEIVRSALRLAASANPLDAGPSLPRFFRPPYGLRDWRVLRVARDLGLETVLWSSSPRDWQQPSSGDIARRVLAEARDGAIVLLHDGDANHAGGRPNTADALPAILDGLAMRGLAPVTLDTLLAEGTPDASAR